MENQDKLARFLDQDDTDGMLARAERAARATLPDSSGDLIAMAATVYVQAAVIDKLIDQVEDLKAKISELDGRCDYISGHVGIEPGV